MTPTFRTYGVEQFNYSGLDAILIEVKRMLEYMCIYGNSRVWQETREKYGFNRRKEDQNAG